MKTRNCEDCDHHNLETHDLVCEAGHKPRFYKPKSPTDFDWGWKRKCEDFKEIDQYTQIRRTGND